MWILYIWHFTNWGSPDKTWNEISRFDTEEEALQAAASRNSSTRQRKYKVEKGDSK